MIKMRNVCPICGSGKSVAGMFVFPHLFFPHPMSLVNKAAGKDTQLPTNWLKTRKMCFIRISWGLF